MLRPAGHHLRSPLPSPVLYSALQVRRASSVDAHQPTSIHPSFAASSSPPPRISRSRRLLLPRPVRRPTGRAQPASTQQVRRRLPPPPWLQRAARRLHVSDHRIQPVESRRPFRALLDVGLIRTTTGNLVFGALTGALDGGLDIPHSDKRFAGFKKDDKQLDSELHKNNAEEAVIGDVFQRFKKEELFILFVAR